MAQCQPSKPQCLVHENGGEADQRNRLNNAGCKIDVGTS